MKTAISIPDAVFDAADLLAKRLKMSRSELYATAVRRFVQAHAQEKVTEALNAVYEKLDSSLDPVVERAQLDVLRRERW